MKKTAIFAILIISVFLIGCAKSEIEAMSEKEYEKVKTAADNLPSAPSEKTYTVTETESESGKTYTTTEGTERTIDVTDTSTGDTTTFKKLDMYERTKEVTETCDLPYPLECTDYMAKDGIIYLTIKNVGYQSKLDQVTLTLDGDYCDPTETYIETGQRKEFECYGDKNADYVSGKLDIEYYMPIGDKHDSKVGPLVVLME